MLGPGREWTANQHTAEEIFVRQYVLSFTENDRVVSAAQVLEQVRAVNTCTTYNSREGEPKLDGEVKLAPLPGVDGQYAFCERIERAHPDRPYGACTVLLARAEVVSRVRVRTAYETKAKELLPALAAEAAKAIATLK